MAERFEYDVIRLKAIHDAQDRRCFKWQSRKGGCHDMDHDHLEEMLNRLGSEGWRVVSHDTDAAYGSTLVLMRTVEEGSAAPAGHRSRTVTVTPSPEVVKGLSAVASELSAIRADLAQQPIATVDPALLSALSDLKGIFNRPVAPTVATLDAAAAAQLTELAQRPTPTFPAQVQAIVDPGALKALEETLRLAIERSQAAPAQAVIDPESLRFFESLVSRDDRPEPPAGPTVAVLGDDAAVRIGELIREASEAFAAKLPVPQVQVRATMDPGSLPTLSATVDPQVLARLEEILRVAVARPVTPATAYLAEGSVSEIGAQLARAVENLPVPQVTVERVDLAELRQSLLAVVSALPAPEVAVTTQLAPEAVQQLTVALTAAVRELRAAQPTTIVQTLDNEAVARVEAAVTRAVDAVFAAPEEETEPVTAPLAQAAGRWSWPKVSERLRFAFGR